jgi:hypothetical protein
MSTAKKPRKLPALKMNEDYEYILVRMKLGDPLVSHQGIRSSGWWTIGSGPQSKTVDAVMAKAIVARYGSSLGYEIGKFQTKYVLNESGQEFVKTLPDSVSADYKTPKQRRNDEWQTRFTQKWAEDMDKARQATALRDAERKVIELAKAVFEQKASFDDLEAAVSMLKALEASKQD